jgi:hypothetical protein
VTWSLTNLVIQTVTGMVGGNLATMLGKEFSSGVLGHTVAGLVGGALSGYFLQVAVGTVVTGSGEISIGTPVEQALLQGIAGLAAGATLAMLIGLLKHGVEQHRMTKD